VHLAYIISAYQCPEQLIRLVRRLNAETASFFVHVDKKTPDGIYRVMVEGLHTLPNVHFVKRHRCDWGGFGHVAATLEGIAAILKTSTPFDFAILLTGQDYPIKPNGHIAGFFERHRGKSFLEFFPLPSDAWYNRGSIGGMDRIEAWHWRIRKRHIRFPPSDRFPIKRKFPAGCKPFGGSSYWCLPRGCIEYIHELTIRNPAVARFFRYVDVPDEIFFQTVVMNSPFQHTTVNDNLRYIDWKDPAAGSPGVLGKRDFEKLAASPKLFARKFDARVDGEVLDLIDERLLDQA
jgi:Core-2/I-Branching enzyme